MMILKRTLQTLCNVRLAGIGTCNSYWRSPRFALFVLAALIVAGCSTRFIYNRLDSLVVWKVDDLVDLRKDQKVELKRQVGDQLEYVRLYDMPRLSGYIRQTSAEIETNVVTPELLEQRYTEMLQFMDEFMLNTVPIAEWFLLSLDDAQVSQMFADLEEMNQEMYEDYSGRTAAERRANRDESALEMAARFVGRLSSEQKALITTSLAEMDDASEQWIEYQREWQRRFRELIENPSPSAEFRNDLTLLLVYPRSFHSPEYRATVDANRQRFYILLAEFVASLSDNQRRRLIDKLDGYADTLDKLSRPDT